MTSMTLPTSEQSSRERQYLTTLRNAILHAYKEHYDFPTQGESHMRDVIDTELEAFVRAITLSGQTAESGEAARWRPEVVAFADAMEEKLRANDWKGGWKDDSSGVLMNRVLDEMHEFKMAHVAYPRDTVAYRANLRAEGADVANMVMMVLDVCGALSTPSALPAQAVGEKAHPGRTPPDYKILNEVAAQALAMRVERLAAPMPQPEPTSKGAKLLAAINAGTAFADGDAEAAWIAHSEHLNCPACGGSGHVDDVSSQQREPQEAAEREAQLQEAREQGWRAAIDVHSRHGMAGWSSHKDAALSAPQEASKPAPKQFYIKNIGGAFDEWEEIPASKEAGKVEPVADEPVAWQERQQTKDGWTDWYNVKAKTAMGKGPGFCEIIGGIKYQWRPLYLRPTQQALSVLVDSFRRRAIIPQSRMSELAQGRISAFEAAADELAAILAAAGGSEK